MTTATAPTDPTLVWLHKSFSIDPEWCLFDDERTLTWWPSRYPQTITVTATEEGIRATARTLIVDDLSAPATARAFASRLNASSPGVAVHLDGDERQLVLSSSHLLIEDDLADLVLFADHALLQAITAPSLAPHLANLLNGTNPVIAHPSSGIRTDRDELLDMLTFRWWRPETVLIPHLTEQLYVELEDALHEICESKGDSSLVTISRQANTLTLTVPLTQVGAQATVTARFTGHPDLGRTFSIVLATALVFDTIDEALIAADTLNRSAPSSARAPGLGGWWARGRQLVWSAYLQDWFLDTFPPHHQRRAQRLAELVWSLSVRAHHHSLTLETPEAFAVSVQPWAGLANEPAPAHPWLPDLAATKAELPRLARENPDSGLEIPIESVGPRPDALLGMWGIVNPAGPTLSTIGFTKCPDGWVFLEWMRHPHQPQVRLLGTYETLDSETVSRACQRWLINTYGDPEEAVVPDGLPEFVIPPDEESPSVIVRDALLTIAATRCEPVELLRSADAYTRFASDPWARLLGPHSECPLDTTITSPEEAAQAWWEAATDDEHLDASLRAILQMWDTTAEFLAAVSEDGLSR